MSTAEKVQKAMKPKTPKISELVDNTKSMILATIDADGNPASSYAPYVYMDGSFYILVSYMAKHTKNLKDRKKVSFMLIDDESISKQIYARDRLTIDSEAEWIPTDTAQYQTVIKSLAERHGKVVDVLSGLEDFILFKLSPLKGNYVNGFGSAYSVNPDLSVNEHRKGAHGVQNVE